ncbi:hypothetical protein TNCV_23311 [Trichonephila clavipes]|nr:hypothetical protein TNCV_23311 [Trichonephila clavipes]
MALIHTARGILQLLTFKSTEYRGASTSTSRKQQRTGIKTLNVHFGPEGGQLKGWFCKTMQNAIYQCAFFMVSPCKDAFINILFSESGLIQKDSVTSFYLPGSSVIFPLEMGQSDIALRVAEAMPGDHTIRSAINVVKLSTQTLVENDPIFRFRVPYVIVPSPKGLCV